MGGQFATLAIHTSLMMSSYERLQRAILKILLETSNVKLGPVLLSPDQLEKEASLLKTNLPGSLRLPINDDNKQLLSLYQVMTVKSQIKRNKIMFLVQIPLLLSESFMIYALRPIPLIIGNKFMVISNTEDYIMANLHFDRFYLMNGNELDKCKSIPENNFICKQRHPVYTHLAGMDTCEVSLLLGHHDTVPTNCEFTTANDVWVQMHDPNQWIFSVYQKIRINIVCGGKLNQIWIEDAGTIKLNDNCLLRQDKLEINSHDHFRSNIKKSIVPTISPDIFKNITNPDNRKFNTIYTTHNKSLQEIRDQIKKLKENEKLPYDELQKMHNIHHYTLGYSTLAILITIIAVLIWFKFSTRTTTKVKTRNEIELKIQEFMGPDNDKSEKGTDISSQVQFPKDSLGNPIRCFGIPGKNKQPYKKTFAKT